MISGYRLFNNPRGVYRISHTVAVPVATTTNAVLLELLALSSGAVGAALLRAAAYVIQTANATALKSHAVEVYRATGSTVATTGVTATTLTPVPVSGVMPASSLQVKGWSASGTTGLAVDAGNLTVAGVLATLPFQMLATSPTTVYHVQQPPVQPMEWDSGRAPVMIFGTLRPNGIANSGTAESIGLRLSGAFQAGGTASIFVEIEWAEFDA